MTNMVDPEINSESIETNSESIETNSESIETNSESIETNSESNEKNGKQFVRKKCKFTVADCDMSSSLPPKHVVLRVCPFEKPFGTKPPTKDNWDYFIHEYAVRHSPGEYWQCFFCPNECLQVFKTIWGLKVHLMTAHGIPEDSLARIKKLKIAEIDYKELQREKEQNQAWNLPFEWKNGHVLAAEMDGDVTYLARKGCIEPAELPLSQVDYRIHKHSSVGLFPRPQEVFGALNKADPSFSTNVLETVNEHWEEQMLHILLAAYHVRVNPTPVELAILSRKTGLSAEKLSQWYKSRKAYLRQREKAEKEKMQVDSEVVEVANGTEAVADSQDDAEADDSASKKLVKRQQLTPEQREILREAYDKYGGELPADMEARQALVEKVDLPWKTVRNWFNNRKYRPLAVKAAAENAENDRPLVSDKLAEAHSAAPSDDYGTTQHLADKKQQPSRRGRKPKNPLASQGIFTAKVSWGFDNHGYIIGLRANSSNYPQLSPSVAELVFGNTVTLDVHISGMFYDVDKPVPWVDSHPLASFFGKLGATPLRITSSISTREAVELWTMYFTEDKLARPSEHKGINFVYLLQLRQAVEHEPTGQELIKHLSSVMHANEQACQLRGRGFELLLTLPKDSSNSFIGLLKFDRLPTIMFADIARAVTKSDAAHVPGPAVNGTSDDSRGNLLPPLQSFSSSSFLTKEPEPSLDTEFAVRNCTATVVNTIHNVEFKVSLHSGPWLDAPASVVPTAAGQSVLATCPIGDMTGFIKRVIASFHNQRVAAAGKPVRVYLDRPQAPQPSHLNCATCETQWDGVLGDDIGLRYFDKTTRVWTDAFSPNKVSLKTLQVQALKLACELV